MMATATHATEFFQADGTLPPNSPSYIARAADTELFQQLLAGRYCYILTSRQSGKSSLISRTVERLHQASIAGAIVDLSRIGAQATPEQWYFGLVIQLANELHLAIDPHEWWRRHGRVGPVLRFTNFLHDFVLEQIAEPVVIFVDNVDTALTLDFRDDFFAAIRAMYNARANDPDYNRLTFVLAGVAMPAELIRDRARTPFNIGYAIKLPDFRRAEARSFEHALERIYPGQGRRMLDRVFAWTRGHPYLTQKVCLAIARPRRGVWADEHIDRLIDQLFFAPDADDDSNLQFVHDSVEAAPDQRRLLRLYQRVYARERVVEDQRSAVQQRLDLIGLVRAEHGLLRVSNAIYRHVFDQHWISANMPRNWLRIAAVCAVLLALLALAGTLWIVESQQQQERAAQIAFATARFRSSSDPDVQLIYLSTLCAIQPDAARELFFRQSDNWQVTFFEGVRAGEAGADLVGVVGCLRPAVAQRGRPAGLVKSMSCALRHSGRKEADQLAAQLGYAGDCPAK